MSIKRIVMEFGPNHIISRITFSNNEEVTAVGMDTGAAALAMSNDAEESNIGQLAEQLASNVFNSVLETLTGEQGGGEEGKHDGD